MLALPRPLPNAPRLRIAIYPENGDAPDPAPIPTTFSNRPRIRNPVTNVAKSNNATAKNPYFGIPAARNESKTITDPMTVVMMTDCSNAPISSSSHFTPICRGRPGIIQNSRKMTPANASSRNPTIAISPYSTSASSTSTNGRVTIRMNSNAPSRPKDCPRIQSHCALTSFGQYAPFVSSVLPPFFPDIQSFRFCQRWSLVR